MSAVPESPPSAAALPAELPRVPGRRLDLGQIVAGFRAVRERWRDS